MFFFQLPVLPEVLLTAFSSSLFYFAIHQGREDVIGAENIQVYMDLYRRPSRLHKSLLSFLFLIFIFLPLSLEWMPHWLMVAVLKRRRWIRAAAHIIMYKKHDGFFSLLYTNSQMKI